MNWYENWQLWHIVRAGGETASSVRFYTGSER